MPLNASVSFLQSSAVEPMQVDAPVDEPMENNEEVEQPFVVENPSFDLETYANSYTGYARLVRLLYIADHCPSLRIDALKMALVNVQTTFNVLSYQQIHRKLVDITGASGAGVSAADSSGDRSCRVGPSGENPNDGEALMPDVALAAAPPRAPPDVVAANPDAASIPPYDAAWVETRTKKAALKLEKLDTDLKNYKSNSIKESIRRGHDDLGDHYLDCGDLTNAMKCYSRARDYCTTGKHVINMCLNVIKVAVYLQNWSHVLSYVNKAESTPELSEVGRKESMAVTQTQLRCAAGLAELCTKKYKAAAKHFLQASLDHCDFPELLSANNVAIYGGLCALASFNRQELKRHTISNSGFKLFLEMEPQLRDVILQFYESRYDGCLKKLEELKNSLLLDMYLAPHVRTLYTQIRNRALIQYFSPYTSADMKCMATAFNTTVKDLEDEIIQLILDGQIQARIDSHNKVLYARAVDQRSATFEKVLEVGRENLKTTKALILRTALSRAQICVKSPMREMASGMMNQNIDGIGPTQSNSINSIPRNS
ncbi:unnamed protein product [Notodromas monacha]|uniref:PCI domain-containing protein n=1 Tax=Notodromas monacha TaxID=399045 RepID=A0A7R9BKP5_9CRUS|nr:unnamed protein product [Notodromas monacha]CAG0917261.1 unnamed protein product [Notodromas monacha]